jgi:hypothetical protein
VHASLAFLRRALLLAAALTVLLVLVGAAWVATNREQARALRQATTIGLHLAAASGAGNSRLGSILGGDVQPARVQQVGGLPATVVAPRSDVPAPAIVLLVPGGTTPAEDRATADAQRAIAAAGLMGWAVRVPSVDQLLLDEDAAAQVARLLADIAADRRTRDGRVSVLATGAVASIALRAAAEEIDAEIPAIVALQPIADARSLVRRALTDPTIDPQLRRDAGRAIAGAALRELDGANPWLRVLVDQAGRSDDPIAALRAIPDEAVSGPLRAVLTVTRATDQQAFDAAWAQLPEQLRSAVERHTPLAVAPQVSARVLLVDDPTQPAAARDGIELLHAQLRDARIVSLADRERMYRMRELLGVSAWWLRRAGA